MLIMIWVQGYQQFEHSGSVVERSTLDQGVASTESLCCVPIFNPYNLLLHYVYHDLGPRLSADGAQWLSGRVLDSRPRVNPYTLLLHYVYHDLGPRLSADGAQWLSGRALDSRPRGCLYVVTVLCPHL